MKNCNYVDKVIWMIIFIILNSFCALFIVIYGWIDKNALWILLADKIILIDIAAFCAIGKKNDWKIFKYWSKIHGNNEKKVKK